jgi:ABC-2 type transport system permease protein
MQTFKSLQFLRLFKGLFQKFGIDYEAMQKILTIKLTMDQRRVPTIFNESKKKEGNQLFKSLWIYALYGIILIPFMLLGTNYIFQMSLVFGMIIFIIMTSMISDFSTVLLDVRDKNILNTKPINRRTISAAKVVHVMIYMTVITGAFVAIPLVVGLVKHGIIFSIVFFIDLIFTLLFIVVLTALIYLFVLRFFDGERLKDMINYVQIMLTVGIIVGYQILIHSFNVVDFDIIYSFSWWHVFIPPLWYGATFELAVHQVFTGPLISLAVLGFAIPVIAIFLYARLMPSFERNLEKLLSDSGKERKSNWLINLWATITCRSKEERLFFRFAMTMMRKEREFKLKVYPGIGMALVFPFIFIFIELSERSIADISTGRTFLFIYFCNYIIPMAVHMLKFSGSYRGSWLLKAAPIVNRSAAYSGTLKAFLVRLYLPVFLLLSVVFTWIYTLNVIPELVAVLLGGILQTLITYKMINNETYPFSNSFEFAQETDGFKMFLLSIFTGVFVIAHLVSTFINYGVYIYIAVLLIIIVVGWRIIFPKTIK